MGTDSGFEPGGMPVTLALSEKTDVEAFSADGWRQVAVLISQPYSLPVQMVMPLPVAERWRDALVSCLRGAP